MKKETADYAKRKINRYKIIVTRRFYPCAPLPLRLPADGQAGNGLRCLSAVSASQEKGFGSFSPLLNMCSSAFRPAYASLFGRAPLRSLPFIAFAFLFRSASLCGGLRKKLFSPLLVMRPVWGVSPLALRGVNSHNTPLRVPPVPHPIWERVLLHVQRSSDRSNSCVTKGTQAPQRSAGCCPRHTLRPSS
jgi:hypothetical protein